MASTPSEIRPKNTTSAGNLQANPSLSGVNTFQQKKAPSGATAAAHRHRISLEDDHEIYLQLMAGENKEAVEKTANQLQLEVCFPPLLAFCFFIRFRVRFRCGENFFSSCLYTYTNIP
jgi:hypothetical protein